MTRRRPFTTYRRGDPHPESQGPGYRGVYPPAHIPKTVRPEDFRRPGQSKPRPVSEQSQRAPAKPAAEPSPPAAKVNATAVKRGAKERPEWVALARRLKTLRERGKLPHRNAAFHAVQDWLVAKKKGPMASSTIYAGLYRHCAGWWD